MTVSAFWIGKFEVMRGQFDPFVSRTAGSRDIEAKYSSIIDIITGPSEYAFYWRNCDKQGSKYPANNITQHSANKFCQWISYKTGHFYRLPTEAEWEYACRAGTKGVYSCPSERLGDYAVLDPEQTRIGAENIGTKKPNPWGIYDMHGNMIEWCLDQYDSKLYKARKSKASEWQDPIVRATKHHPRVARGGSWYDPAEELRSATRIFSDPSWQQTDPRDPQSSWYLDADWIGFRVVRPLKIPSADEMYFYWNCDGPEYLKGKAAEKK